MKRTDVIIIGGGQAGLAMSHELDRAGVDHVILEKGRVAESWKSRRWDSLRVLTPNWQTRLPGFGYGGSDPHGFMRATELADYLTRYADSFCAPVLEHTDVLSVRSVEGVYRVETSRGVWVARAVVIATGHCMRPAIPAMADELPVGIRQLTPTQYRNPDQLPPGNVLVVGGSASGVQLADELRRAGRGVVLAVGSHTRLPRRYRGHDIMWWLDRSGRLDRRPQHGAQPAAAGRGSSLQLVGRPTHDDIDLHTLMAAGVRPVGRVIGTSGGRVFLADDLAQTVGAAEDKQTRVLDAIDAYAADHPEIDVAEPHRPTPIWAPQTPRVLDLAEQRISTVIWATGFRRAYPWLQVPVTDANGDLLQRGGVTAAPGLFAMGLYFMRRRNSSFVDGVRHDARDLTFHVMHHLAARAAA